MVDFLDLCGYYYYNGVVFVVYCFGYLVVIVFGGCYDGVGKIFGRVCFVIGFLMDL